MYKFKPMDKVICINNTNDTKIQQGFVGYVIYVIDDKMCITDNKSSLNARTYLVNTCDFAPASLFDFAPSDLAMNKENKKKGNDIMKLLEIYIEKQEELLHAEYKKENEEITHNDEIYKRIKEFEAKLREEFKQTYLCIDIEQYECTHETKELLEKSEKEYYEKRHKLGDKLAEINAQLEICETYEQKIKVLENYEVIDKKTHQVN